MFPANIYTERRNTLRKKFKSGILLFMGNDDVPMNYPSNTLTFRQDSNFLYFFGIDQPGLTAIMDIEAGTDIIFGNDVTLDDIIWMGPQPSLRDTASRAGVASAAPLAELKKTLELAIRKGRNIRFLPPYRAESIMKLGRLLGIHTAQINNYASLDLIKGVVAMRSIKSAEELQEMERAARIGQLMHMRALKLCKPGAEERTLSGAVHSVCAEHDCMPSFPVILSQRGEILHNHSHDLSLQEGKLLLIDAGAESPLHYASDYTRTFPVSGTFTTKQAEIYQLVLDANNLAQSLIKPGIPYQEIHLKVALCIAQGLKVLGLMKGDPKAAVENGAHALFMPHGLGHLLGLDVHDMEDLGEQYVGYDDEITRSKQFGTASLRFGRRLQANMVLTVEPGIYFIPALIDKWKSEHINESFICYDKLETYRDFGGIRLEDNVVVTKTGCKIVGGKRLPITIAEIERLMEE